MGTLVIQNIYKRYDGRMVLKDVHFEMEAGDIVGIVGPNGAGKTTLIRILATLLKPTRGHFKIDHLSSRENIQELRKRIGYCPDKLPEDGRTTGNEFLKFISDYYSKRRNSLDEVIRQVGLENDINRPIVDYSKGMKKRISLAQVLLIDPVLYLLDEPTSGLDPAGKRKIQDIILSMERKEKIIFVSSHDLYEVDRICDRIFSLANGKLEEIQSARDMFNEGSLTITEITFREVEDELIRDLLNSFDEFTFLSYGENRLRLSSAEKVKEERVRDFVRKKGGEVDGIEFL